MNFFKKRNEIIKKKDAAFKKKIDEANRLMTALDMKIADYRRRYQNLQMRGPDYESVTDLEWMLKEMRLMAVNAQQAIDSARIKHKDCVAIVDSMIKEFEEKNK